jgi:hypothetical protein
MKKIRLDLSELKVESFVTSAGAAQEGTVFGMANTICETTCDGIGETCNGAGCPSDADCQDYTADDEQSCTSTDCGGGTIPSPDTDAVEWSCDGTCDQTPDSCDGIECQPD